MRARYHLAGAAALVVLLFAIALNAYASAPAASACPVGPSLDLLPTALDFHHQPIVWRSSSRALLEPEPRRLARSAPLAGIAARVQFAPPTLVGGMAPTVDRPFVGRNRAHTGGRSPPLS